MNSNVAVSPGFIFNAPSNIFFKEKLWPPSQLQLTVEAASSPLGFIFNAPLTNWNDQLKTSIGQALPPLQVNATNRTFVKTRSTPKDRIP
jgi:hypothetical protein